MSDIYQNISSVAVDEPSTWKDKKFITIDIDWADDAIIHDSIDLIERSNTKVTWFVTHASPALDRLRENPNFELGVHPNFNFLLSGSDKQGKDAEEVLGRLLDIVPDAKSVRSHSMTQNTNLLDLFYRNGLTHDCNHFIPYQSGVPLQPWVMWTGLTKVPYSWEDDVACLYGDIAAYEVMKNVGGLCVFDFHPIHLFLNTENMDRYEQSRDIHRDPEVLIEHRNHDSVGARDVLIDILEWK